MITATETALSKLERLTQIYQTAMLEGNADILSYYAARNTLATQRIDLLKLGQSLAELGIALETAAGQYFSGSTLPPVIPSQPGSGQGAP